MTSAAPGAALPTGTLTFLFTDIEGSTRLLQDLRDRYAEVQRDHAAILREAIALGGGVELRTEGDAFFAVFPTATGALRAAVESQRRLAAHDWSHGGPLRVRMGMHTGEGRLGGDDYLGIDVNIAARIVSAASGGQVLLSAATRSLVEGDLPEGVRLRDLGAHRLKDIEHIQNLFDLEIEGLPARFAPPKTLDARPNNLPAPLTSFVGRKQETAAISELLERSRLVTLRGPGGTGKTRLALEVARASLSRFADGAWFVDLAPLRDPTLVTSAALAALGVSEDPTRPPVDPLVAHLAPRSALVVFDNFEQVLEGADVVQAILEGAPGVHVLVTSREALRLAGEHVYGVPPLAAPEPEALDPETAASFAAVELFSTRARAVRGDFELDKHSVAWVARICAALDGLPLAIELAASRVNVLSPREISDRLAGGVMLATSGPRDLPERQRTLAATIGWSYDLLRQEERQALERLSVFAGGATIVAAEAVIGRVDVLDLVSSLVDKSLVRRTEDAATSRFTMLETIREFAGERLRAAGDERDARAAHTRWVLDFAERAEPELVGEDMNAWLDRCEREHDNIRAALGFAIDEDDAATAQRVCAALWRFWQQRGHLREGSTWTEMALALEGPRDEPRFRALTAAGGLAYWRNDVEATRRAYEEAVDVARELGDPRLELDAFHNRSFVPIVEGRHADALPYLESALELAKQLEDDRMVGRITSDIGWVMMATGSPQDAVPRFERTVAMFRELGERWQVIDNVRALGIASRMVGDHARARACFGEALDAAREARDVSMALAQVETLAGVLSDEGKHERAALFMGAAQAARDRIGGGPPASDMFVGEVLPRARAALGDAEVERLLSEGTAVDDEGLFELGIAEARGG